VDLDAAEGRLHEPEVLVLLAEQSDHEVVAGDADLDAGSSHGSPFKGSRPGA
jgi:hypothetical protein